MRRQCAVSSMTLLMAGVICLALFVPVAPAPLYAQGPQPTPVAPDDPQAAADQLFAEAERHYQQNDLPAAAALLDRALALYRAAGDREGEAMALYSKGLIVDQQGGYAQALQLYQHALVLMRSLENHAAEWRILNSIGQVYSRRELPAAALPFYQQARQAARAAREPAGEAQTLTVLGTAYAYQGTYDQAMASYQEALAIFQAAGNRAGQADALHRIGTVHSFLGQFADALKVYQDALTIYRELDDKTGQVTVSTNIGLIYDTIGQPYSALKTYESVIVEASTEVQDPVVKMAFLNNLGAAWERSATSEQDFKAIFNLAMTYYQGALTFAIQAFRMEDAMVILGNIGLLYSRSGRYEEAINYLQNTLHEHQRAENRPAEAVTLHYLGDIYQKLGRLEEAREMYEQAMEIRRAIGDVRGQAQTLGSMGSLYELRGDSAAALDYYQQSIAAAEDIRAAARLEELKTSVDDQSSAVYARAIMLLIEQKQYVQAFELSERARARSFLDQIGNNPPKVYAGADQQLLAQEQEQRAELASLDQILRAQLALPADQRDPNEISAIEPIIAAQRQRYANLLTQIKLQNPEYSALRSIDTLTLPALQQLLDQQTTLLSYFVTSEATIVFVIARDRFEAVTLPLKPDELVSLVTSFRQFSNTEAGVPASLQTLYNGLIAPVKKHLTTQTVGIIPHGILHYLPFAALADGERYFGEQFTLFTLPSASVVPYIKPKPAPVTPSMLAVVQSQAAGLATLQHAEAETRAVAALYETSAIENSAATESLLQERGPGTSILHLAAHGELNLGSPLFSRILLAPDARHDGLLEVHEIYGLDLSNADLVVLSACETQLGPYSHGDEIVGLNRAFFYAGASTVVASLWNVDDQATQLLMTSFYKHLRAGQGKAVALQSAQSELRTNYPQYAHPYYWAGFVLNGEPGAPQTTSSVPMWLWISICIIVALIMTSGALFFAWRWKYR